MSDKDVNNLAIVVEAIDKIENYLSPVDTWQELEKNILVFDGILMNFILIGEMCARLSEGFRKKHTHIDWRGIISFRNIVAHDYLGVDVREIWQIIKSELPKLRDNVSMILVVEQKEGK